MKTAFRLVLILLIGVMTLAPARTSAAMPLTSLTVRFRSIATHDGWVLESGENTNVGGTGRVGGTTFILGDNAGNRQYRSILSFNTSNLPDTATIVQVKLKIKSDGLVGTDPFTTHGKLIFDMRKPFFGASSGLVPGDFEAAATKPNAGRFNSTPVSGGSAYVAFLPATSFLYINKKGLTQFRLRFALDDNNDADPDYMTFRSGEYVEISDRPVLEIEYNP